MLNKNEIRLAETQKDQLVRRMVFTKLGFIRLVEDFHFEGIKATEGKLEVKEVSPTTRLFEDDLVIEISTGMEDGRSLTRLLEFKEGRLRLCSLSSHFLDVQKAISRNREIGKWINTTRLYGMHFPDQSWFNPMEFRHGASQLRSLIPSEELWGGLVKGLDTKALVMSYLKLYRLYSRNGQKLTSRTTPIEMEYTPETFTSGDFFFKYNARGNKAYFVQPDAEEVPMKGHVYLRVSKVAELDIPVRLDTAADFNYNVDRSIYKMELVNFSNGKVLTEA